jgi:hypothetical protein
MAKTLNYFAYPFTGCPPRSQYIFPFDPKTTYYPGDVTGLYDKKQKIVAYIEAFRRRSLNENVDVIPDKIGHIIFVEKCSHKAFAFSQLSIVCDILSRSGIYVDIVRSNDYILASANGQSIKFQYFKKTL